MKQKVLFVTGYAAISLLGIKMYFFSGRIIRDVIDIDHNIFMRKVNLCLAIISLLVYSFCVFLRRRNPCYENFKSIYIFHWISLSFHSAVLAAHFITVWFSKYYYHLYSRYPLSMDGKILLISLAAVFLILAFFSLRKRKFLSDNIYTFNISLICNIILFYIIWSCIIAASTY